MLPHGATGSINRSHLEVIKHAYRQIRLHEGFVFDLFLTMNIEISQGNNLCSLHLCKHAQGEPKAVCIIFLIILRRRQT